MKRLVLTTLFLLSISTAAQGKRGFVIDSSKPYVYLKFDRIGNRKPLSRREPDKGLWLRLENNCSVPITVEFFDPGNGDPGVGLYDEVIPINLNALPLGHGFRPGEDSSQNGQSPQEKPPEGYSPSEVVSTTTVAPGKNLLFSVPVNHVGPSWYLRIKFYLDVPGTSYGVGPYSMVSFIWQHIPDKIRANLHP